MDDSDPPGGGSSGRDRPTAWTHALLLASSRQPAAVGLRLLLWPTVILLLSSLAAWTQADGLSAGLLAFLVTAGLGFLLALVDGLVLRARPLLLVWSVTTVLVALLLVAQPVIDHVLHGPEWSTWAEAVQLTVEDLPSELAFFVVLVDVPVALGVLAGSALRRSVRPRPDRLPEPPTSAPRAADRSVLVASSRPRSSPRLSGRGL